MGDSTHYGQPLVDCHIRQCWEDLAHKVDFAHQRTQVGGCMCRCVHVSVCMCGCALPSTDGDKVPFRFLAATQQSFALLVCGSPCE